MSKKEFTTETEIMMEREMELYSARIAIRRARRLLALFKAGRLPPYKKMDYKTEDSFMRFETWARIFAEGEAREMMLKQKLADEKKEGKDAA